MVGEFSRNFTRFDVKDRSLLFCHGEPQCLSFHDFFTTLCCGNKIFSSTFPLRIIVVVFFKYQFFLENGYIEFFYQQARLCQFAKSQEFQMFELPSNFRVQDSFTRTEQ